MCGRVVTPGPHDLTEFGWEPASGFEVPDQRFNVPPTSEIPIGVRPENSEKVQIYSARWGLLPPFAKDLSFSSKTFNARAETLLERPSFRGPVMSQRALIPVAGYFEWQTREDGSKQPYYICGPKAGKIPLVMAGLYSWWAMPDLSPGTPERWVLTCTIVTCEATGQLANIHSRMPVFLPRGFWADWLGAGKAAGTAGGAAGDGAAGKAEAKAIVLDEIHNAIDQAQHVSASLDMWPVGKAVGNVRNHGPELIEPLATE